MKKLNIDEVAKFMTDPEQFKKDFIDIKIGLDKYLIKYGELGLNLLSQEMLEIENHETNKP
jgi:hypothetical protein